VLSQILKPRNYITFIDLEIGPKLALVLKQVNKRRYKLKRKKKNLISPLIFKGRIKTIFNLAEKLSKILTVLTVFCIKLTQ
jgi:hypothetical protein